MTAISSGAGHIHSPLVQPILFCGPGSNLYPLCSTTNPLSPLDINEDVPSSAARDLPKAMLPILNRPMLAYPLQQLLSSGLRHAIIFAPSEQHQQLAAALKSLILIPPVLVQSGKKLTSSSAAAAAAAVEEASRNPNISVSVGLSSTSAQTNPTAYMSANNFSVSSVQNETVMRVDLLPLGPDDVSTAKNEAELTSTTKKYKKLGTAGLINWLNSIGRLDKDPLIIPIDLVSQNVSLSAVIHGHVANVPEPPALTCLMYERGAGEGTGKEREKDGPPKLFTAYDRSAGPSARLDPTSSVGGTNAQLSTHQLLMLQDSDDVSDLDASDLHLRMSLLWSHPHVRISTSLLDSHIYLFSLPKLLGLLRSEGGQKMKSLREEVVPFMVKCSWMTGLREKAGWHSANGRVTSPGSSAPWSTQLSKEDSSGVHRSTTYVEPELLQAGPSLSRLTFDDMARGSPLFTPDQSILLTPSSANGNSKELTSAELTQVQNGSSDADRQKLRAAARISAAETRTNAIIVRLSADLKHPIDPSMSVDEFREMEERNGKHPQFIARANTVPTYMECNRHLLRSLTSALGSTAPQGGPLIPGSLAHPLPNQALSAPFAQAVGLTATIPNSPLVDADSTTSESSVTGNSSRSTPLVDPKAQISSDSLVGEITRVGERTTVKRSVVGRGCLIGKNVKIIGCVIMDGVRIGDNAKLENCILCPASVVEEKCNLKDCDVAAAVKVTSGTNSKSEKFDE